MKTCSRCGESKPLEEFCRDKRNKDGRGGACLACERERSRRGYREVPGRKEYVAAAGKRWRAENPERQRETNRRRYWRDPEKHRARKRAWDAENRELVNARAREFYAKTFATPGGRARILESNARNRIGVEGGPDPEVIAKIADLYQQPCAYCGATDDIEIDHIVPTSRGGKHEIENLAPCCGFCNKSKRDKLVEEWLGVAA